MWNLQDVNEETGDEVESEETVEPVEDVVVDDDDEEDSDEAEEVNGKEE